MAATDTRPNQRDHILDVALKLMSERGAAGMSMRQLASACGVQVAAIYHYFDSKHALLAAVVEERRYGSRLADPLELDRSALPEDRLRALFGVVWDGALQEEEIWSLLLGEGIRGEEAVMDVGRDLLALVRDAAREWVREVIPEAQPSEQVADLLVGQLLAGFVRRVFEPDSHDVAAATRIGQQCADTLVAAVFPDS
ncbi:MAG: TetR/AcrR family transcriptional regulator [Microthrixaceae bacterium]